MPTRRIPVVHSGRSPASATPRMITLRPSRKATMPGCHAALSNGDASSSLTKPITPGSPCEQAMTNVRSGVASAMRAALNSPCSTAILQIQPSNAWRSWMRRTALPTALNTAWMRTRWRMRASCCKRSVTSWSTPRKPTILPASSNRGIAVLSSTRMLPSRCRQRSRQRFQPLPCATRPGMRCSTSSRSSGSMYLVASVPSSSSGG